MKPEKAEPLALKACKVIMRASVSASAKAVGAILLDHVNWKTGRCDPGLERIAKLSGCCRKAAWSGIQQLVAKGFVKVTTHGGGSDRNRYQFQWAAIREADQQAQEAFGCGRKLPGGVVENYQGGVVENYTQTRRSKPEKVFTLRTKGSPPHQGRKGQAKGSEADRRQSYMMHSVDGGKGTPRKQAVENARHRQTADRIAALPRDQQGPAWEEAIARG